MDENTVTRKIITLLSQHRQPDKPTLPAPLRRVDIVNALHRCAAPGQENGQLEVAINEILSKLEMLGEVLRGANNYYCMAPPIIFSGSEDIRTEHLKFRGDRAYLPLAHRILKTSNPNQERLLSRVSDFHHAKMELARYGIRLVTLRELIEELPLPSKPQVWSSQPIPEPLTGSDCWQYTPAHCNQSERWRLLSREGLTNESLIKVDFGKNSEEYFWLEDGKWYQLEKDQAIYAMFYLDRRDGYPLRIIPYRNQELDLSGIYLPKAYYQWCERYLQKISRSVYRVEGIKQSLIKILFERLGCIYDEPLS